MSTLSSSSTYSDVKAAYYDNASWFEDASVAKALAFVTACKFLILWIPKRQQNGQNEAEFSVEGIREEMSEARNYVETKGRSGGNKGYRQYNMGKFR